MTIQEAQKEFQKEASVLGDYQLLSKNELANGYCDWEEFAINFREDKNIHDEIFSEQMRSGYFAALMLRYWYKIFEWIQNSSSLHLEPIDFVTWLHESLNDALYYRSWRKTRHNHQAEKENGYTKVVWMENPQYVDDPNAADKSINYFITAKRGKEYQYYNKDKRKAGVQVYSLDSLIDEKGDYAINFTGAYVEPEHESKTNNLIYEFIHRGEMIEALIVDGITNYDTFNTDLVTKKEIITNRNAEGILEEKEEEFTSYSHSFSDRKLVKHLNSINQEFMFKFCERYDVQLKYGDETFNRLKKLTNTKLYKLIEKTLIEIKQSKELMECWK